MYLGHISGVCKVGGKGKGNRVVLVASSALSTFFLLLLVDVWEWKAIEQEVYDAGGWLLKRTYFDVLHFLIIISHLVC